MSFYRKNRRPVPEEEKCADPAKARVRALDALAAREMTSTQLYERLCNRFTEQAAAAAVAEMLELDYVNDDRYAEARAHGLLMARVFPKPQGALKKRTLPCAMKLSNRF